MAAQALVGNTRTGGAVPPLQGQDGLDAKVGEVIEDLVGGVGVVVAAHSGVVPSEHVVGAAQVLADEGMKDRFAGSGVAHIPQQGGSMVDVFLEKPGVPQFLVGQDDGLVDVVPGFLLPYHRADQNSVGFSS